MPTIFEENGFRFFFYSNENNEPVHIHIQKADSYSKFWLKPIRLEYNHGFSDRQIKEIKVLLFNKQNLIEEKWNEFFAK